jgi:hypothetical protein
MWVVVLSGAAGEMGATAVVSAGFWSERSQYVPDGGPQADQHLFNHAIFPNENALWLELRG